MDHGDFVRIQSLHDRMTDHHRLEQRHEYEHLNQEIHVGLVKLAGNSMLTSTHATLITRARRGRHNALESKGRWQEAMSEHERLMVALAERDGRRAGAIMLEHDLHTRDVLKAQRAAMHPE